MENENQKSNLSLADICRIQQEICDSTEDCFSRCPFMKNGELCIVSDLDTIRTHADEIEAICTEWEMNKPTLADKINEILKPYGMELGMGNYYICFKDGYMTHTNEEVADKLTTTIWKGEPNE